MSRIQDLTQLAQQLADERPTLFDVKGPGTGDRDTAAFMNELRARARSAFGEDHSEQRICGEGNNLTVDSYFPEEATVVEIAFALRNPLSEYERDILKALMAKERGTAVSRLIFITKPGGVKRTKQPGALAIAEWARSQHGLDIKVVELAPKHAG